MDKLELMSQYTLMVLLSYRYQEPVVYFLDNIS